MAGAPRKTRIALFVELTRAIRDAAVSDEVRGLAFEALDRMAGSADPAGVAAHTQALADLAARHEALALALEPLWEPLRALQAQRVG
jgi:hypothetical protein